MERYLTTYEYKKIKVPEASLSLYLDGYESFGWQIDERLSNFGSSETCALRLKRDRKIMNKMELTRLERNFEGCMDEIAQLEAQKTWSATMVSIVTGLIGTAFLAGATFAVTAAQPLIVLSIILAVPGFIGWIIPYFIYQRIKKKKTAQMEQLIEKKYDEISALMQKGNSLLNA